MKKNIKLFAAGVAAFALLFSCTKADELDNPAGNSGNEPVEIEQGDGVHSLTLTFPATKTELGTSYDSGGKTYYHKQWSVGDKIVVNGIESKALAAGGSSATFLFDYDISAAAYQVVYPSSAYDSGTGMVTIPAAQAYVEGSFDPAADIILGYGTDPAAITLANAVSYLKIQLEQGDYGSFGVSSIAITASGKMLNGAYAIAGDHLSLTVPSSTATASEQTVTLSATPGSEPVLSGTAKDFLIAIAPQTLSGGFTVTMTDKKGNTMSQTKVSSTAFAAGGMTKMPSLKFQEYVSIKTPSDLLAFAADCSAGSDNYYVIEANIDMDGQVWPEAGTGDAAGTAFRGTLDGGNGGTEDGGYKISNLTSTTGAFIKHAYSTSTIKNVTLDATCSIGYSDDITANCHIGAIVGMTRGTVKYCFNRAPVSCTSTSYTKPIYIGGIAGRLYRMGDINHCYNYAAVTCGAAGGSEEICMGGIVGSLERNQAGDNATMSYCESTGKVDRGTLSDDAKDSPTRIGGVIGRLQTKAGSDKLSISNLVHTSGNISVNYETRTDGISILVGGLIGCIHGTSVSNAAADVDVINSHVSGCTVNNGFFNNTVDYGTAPIVGGLIGLARGVTDGSQNIQIKENCYVNNVATTARRGFFGGLVGWMRGVLVDDCDVLASSAKSSAQGYIAGGVVACAYDSVISECNATLTKYSNSSLYTKGNYLYTGGIVGWCRGTTTIENCRVYVTNMYQATETAGVRGWIAGYCNGTSTTINKCGLGGTYGNTTPTITLTDGNFASHIYGSTSTNVTVGTDANACYYWDGTL